MSEIVIHLHDAGASRPAAHVKVSLDVEDAAGAWHAAGRATTNDEGRAALPRPPLPAPTRAGVAPAARYRLTCDIGVYLARTGGTAPFPEVQVQFADDGRGADPRLRIELEPTGYRVKTLA